MQDEATMTTTPATQLPGLDSLGKLYNVIESDYFGVFGDRVLTGFTDGSDATIDITNGAQTNTYSYPSDLDVAQVGNLNSTTEQGESADAYQSNLAARAKLTGSYGYFSGQVKTTVNEEVSTYQDQRYLSIFDTVLAATAKFLPEQAGSVFPWNSDSNFNADLNDSSVEPTDLFADYGTHIVTGLQIGGQAEYNCFASRSSYESQSQFSIDAEAEYSSLSGSATFQGSLDSATGQQSTKIEGSREINVYGGGVAEGEGVKGGEDGAFSPWAESVIDNMQAFEWAPDGGLTPIWEFCADQDRADAIQEAFDGAFGLTAVTTEDTDPSPTDCTDGAMDWNDDQDHAEQYVNGTRTDFLIGFGAHLNSGGDHKLVRIKLSFQDIDSGATFITSMGGDLDDNYEAWYQVPSGNAITGLAFKKASSKVEYMRVYYQAITTDPDNGFLDPEVRYSDDGCSGGSLDKDEYQRIFEPAEATDTADANQLIIRGVDVSCGKNGFGILRLYQMRIVEDSVEDES